MAPNEILERVKRSNNIIIRGISEDINVESNSSTVRNIVECVTVGAGDHITGISRLGRKQAKGDRPIKVEFSSSSIPSKILRNKIKLTQNTTYSKIKISDDMTPTQLNEIKKVREDIKRR